MSSSSARGQTEPVAALLAVLVVGAGLALYAGVLDSVLDREPKRNVAAATLERVDAHLSSNGIVDPGRLGSVDEVTPDGYRTNVTLTATGQQWSTGPIPEADADRVARTVSVRTAPASVKTGRLRVVVWQ